MDARLISIIVAASDNGVISQNGEIPWNLKIDLVRFRRLTKGHKVIVGRKTHQAILKRLGHPLPDRQTIVITRHANFPVPDNCQVVSSWEKAMEQVGNEEVFVIGGAEVYRQALPYADRIYLTRVHVECEGDTFFPSYNEKEWKVSSDRNIGTGDNEPNCTFITLVRKEPSPEFVNLNNARFEDQRKTMQKIQEEGFCPFCPEHTAKSQLMPVIHQSTYWHVRKNRWPYKNTRVHFLIIHNSHVEKLSEISPEAAQELFYILKWLEQEYQVLGGGIGLRFGDFHLNGATVAHLHAHLISADITNRKDPSYQPVRFRVG